MNQPQFNRMMDCLENMTNQTSNLIEGIQTAMEAGTESQMAAVANCAAALNNIKDAIEKSNQTSPQPQPDHSEKTCNHYIHNRAKRVEIRIPPTAYDTLNIFC